MTEAVTNPTESSSNATAELRKEVQGLRENNERLKELAIQLTAIVIKEIFATHAPKRDQLRPEYVLAAAETCFGLARLPNVGQKLAAALETFGDELSARAVKLDADRECRSQ